MHCRETIVRTAGRKYINIVEINCERKSIKINALQAYASRGECRMKNAFAEHSALSVFILGA